MPIPVDSHVETVVETVAEPGADRPDVLVVADGPFDADAAGQARAVVLALEGSDDVRAYARALRTHPDPAVYLTPLFAESETGLDPLTHALLDGVGIDSEEPEAVLERADDIAGASELFSTVRPASERDAALTRTLRMLMSRGVDALEPVFAREAKLGFAYPVLRAVFGREREEEGLSALEAAEAGGLLAGAFVDAWYTCPECAESALRMRETCPTCGTAEMEEEPLVHHFRCAYVGPMSDFETGRGTFRCPKCDHDLDHLGVDYDKPGSVFTCADGHAAQQPGVVARCFTCGAETPAEKLVKRRFKRYTLTPKGREAAASGVGAAFDPDGVEGAVPTAVFQTMLGYEVERAALGGRPTTLATLRCTNAPAILAVAGPGGRARLTADLVAAVREALHEADAVAVSGVLAVDALIPSLAPDAATEALRQAGARWSERHAGQPRDTAPVLAVGAAALTADREGPEQLAALAAASTSRA